MPSLLAMACSGINTTACYFPAGLVATGEVFFAGIAALGALPFSIAIPGRPGIIRPSGILPAGIRPIIGGRWLGGFDLACSVALDLVYDRQAKATATTIMISKITTVAARPRLFFTIGNPLIVDFQEVTMLGMNIAMKFSGR